MTTPPSQPTNEEQKSVEFKPDRSAIRLVIQANDTDLNRKLILRVEEYAKSIMSQADSFALIKRERLGIDSLVTLKDLK